MYNSHNSQQPNYYQTNYAQDFEMNLNEYNQNTKLSSFGQEMRLGFIRKVYGILAAQLLVTTIFCILSMSSKSFKVFQIQNMALLYFFLIMTIALPCVIVCFQSAMRSYPYNYLVLGGFTISESYIVSFICGYTNPRFVFMAAFMTFALVISLTVYAMTTKTDFTTQGGLLFILGCGFFMFCIFGMFTNNKIFHVILCCLGIILFGFYLLYDTQLILGNRDNELEIDDYILAAFMLYTDIIYLFLRILELIQLLSGNNH
jgi:FtsH-binding integral membrane protein